MLGKGEIARRYITIDKVSWGVKALKRGIEKTGIS